jgi:hypothetical protein
MVVELNSPSPMKPHPKRLRLTRAADTFDRYVSRVCDARGILPPRAATVAVKA